MDGVFFGLLAFVPITIGAAMMGVSPVVLFFLSALAIVPLAKYIGESTEELATRTSAGVGGFLSATFGNATELIIGLFALHAGLLDIVKASITGSIIGNLLFVLGFAMLAGGWKREKQVFNKTAVLANGSTLFLATIALVIPAIFFETAPNAGMPIVEDLSVLVSVVLVLVYVAHLFFSFHTHKHLYLEEAGKYEPRWSIGRSIMTLAASTIFVALMSEILVGAISPSIAALGWSQLFVGVIVLAIVGNAAEHVSAVTTALRSRMDLSLQISIGSATQIAMLVAPVLVITSIFLGTPMNLIFNTFELVAMVLSVLIVNFVVQDGESNWLEGVQLLAAYAIMALAFFFHP